jgi:lipopolysaccharide export system protein LptC
MIEDAMNNRWISILMVLAAVGLTWNLADGAPEEAALPAAESPSDKPAQRIREGTPLEDVTGQFKMLGDRATFYVKDSNAKYNCLENLNLERVTNQLAENPDAQDWTVSGQITEYRGANYLLLGRAILKSKPTGAARAKKPPTNKPGARQTSPK